mgnify:CR=1 FL=1
MHIEIDLNKSVDENAGTYFDLAKKFKKKIAGTIKIIEETKKKLADLEGKESTFIDTENKKQEKKQLKKEWYEKFHWFTSSEGFLCIGGKDATTNEIIIKKYTSPGDLVFHTDMAGSPFFVIKDGQKAGEATKNETAQATAAYSRAWKSGHNVADVFYILPEQVTKEAMSGEYISKGSFMVYGKKNYINAKVECAIGLFEGKIIGGPVGAISAKTNKFVIITLGKEKKSDLAKKIRFKLGGGELDDIVTFLPAGEGEIKK